MQQGHWQQRPNEPNRSREGRPLSDLLAGLAGDLATIFRKEVRLAESETAEKAIAAGSDLALVAAGGALGFAGLIAFTSSAISFLSAIFPRWIAAFLVGSALAGGGAVLAAKGIENLRETDLVPRRTIRSIKEDAEVIKESLT